MSGMVQAVGYTIAFFGPVLLGKLFEIYQDWHMPLMTFLALMVANIYLAWFATHPYMFESKS